MNYDINFEKTEENKLETDENKDSVVD